MPTLEHNGLIEMFLSNPSFVPVVTDTALAEREPELAVLSAMVHGNGPEGLAVLAATLAALCRLDCEHAAGYFGLVWDGLCEPRQRALEALVMEPQTEGKATFSSFAQKLIEYGRLQGLCEYKLKGLREGELKGLRDALLRVMVQAGIALSDADHARVKACDDAATLNRWLDNVLDAKTAADVLS